MTILVLRTSGFGLEASAASLESWDCASMGGWSFYHGVYGLGLCLVVFLRILLKVFGVYVDSCILYRLFPFLVVLQWLPLWIFMRCT